MRFIVDAQLPPALAGWLRESGHDASHVLEIGLLESDDTTIWRHARDSKSIVITKDEDFAALAKQGKGALGIVWLRVGNVSNAGLRSWFMPRLECIEKLVNEDVRLIELR